MTPLKAIRKHCIECSSGSMKEVKICQLEECPLHQFRLGKNPKRAGIGGKGFSRKFIQKSLSESTSFAIK